VSATPADVRGKRYGPGRVRRREFRERAEGRSLPSGRTMARRRYLPGAAGRQIARWDGSTAPWIRVRTGAPGKGQRALRSPRALVRPATRLQSGGVYAKICPRAKSGRSTTGQSQASERRGHPRSPGIPRRHGVGPFVAGVVLVRARGGFTDPPACKPWPRRGRGRTCPVRFVLAPGPHAQRPATRGDDREDDLTIDPATQPFVSRRLRRHVVPASLGDPRSCRPHPFASLPAVAGVTVPVPARGTRPRPIPPGWRAHSPGRACHAPSRGDASACVDLRG
jgi:hypothetical protein